MRPAGFSVRGLLLACSVVLLGIGPVHGQLAPDSARLAVKLSAIQLLQATYGVEAEYRCVGPLSLALSPRLMLGTVPARISEAGNRDGDQIRGYGLGLGLRYYLPNTGAEGAMLAGAYFGLKADYQRLGLDYYAEVWGEDRGPDGLSYYTYRPRQVNETITRLGGIATLGYQCQVFFPRLRMDASASYNRLRSTSNMGELSRYRSSARDYGYSGSFFTLDLQFGFVLK